MVEPHDSVHNNCPSDGGWCEGGFEIFMVFISLFFVVLTSLCCLWCYCTKNQEIVPNQENLEMIERQDQVIKTYQIAKKIISGTAFESLQLTILQTRLHFVCISEYIVMRCNESSQPFNVYWLQNYSRRRCR